METEQATGVEVLINTDETFIHFNPVADFARAPVGANRVGRKIRHQHKINCTIRYNDGMIGWPVCVFKQTFIDGYTATKIGLLGM